MLSAARFKMPPSLESLLKYQMEEAIEQANLGEFGTFVAKKCLIDGALQIDIAEELGYDRSVISRRLRKDILPRVEYTAKVLFGNPHTTAS